MSSRGPCQPHSVTLWSTSNVQGRTLHIQTQIILHSLWGTSALFQYFFTVRTFYLLSTSLPVKDPLGCFHPTRCVCSSTLPGVLVPWPTTWAKTPGHVASSFQSFIQMYLVRSIECGQPCYLFWTHLEGFSALSKFIIEDNFRNFINMHRILVEVYV